MDQNKQKILNAWSMYKLRPDKDLNLLEWISAETLIPYEEVKSVLSFYNKEFVDILIKSVETSNTHKSYKHIIHYRRTLNGVIKCIQSLN